MACSPGAIIYGASSLQGELATFSQTMILRALWEKMCAVGGVSCDPATYLAALPAGVSGMSDAQLLAGIASMACGSGVTPPPAEEGAFDSGFGSAFG